MSIVDSIYTFIGKNNLGITNSQFKWDLDNSLYNISIYLVNKKDFKYYTEVILKSDTTKNIVMTGDKVINYNCSEEDMENTSDFVRKYIQNLDHIFPTYINLNIGDKYICIKNKKITSNVEYDIVKKFYEIIPNDMP